MLIEKQHQQIIQEANKNLESPISPPSKDYCFLKRNTHVDTMFIKMILQ